MQDQFFVDYLDRLTDLRNRVKASVGDLPAEAVDWVPGPGMNSVAVLLAHINGLVREGLDMAVNTPPSRVRAEEFATRGVTRAEMLSRLDAVIDYAGAVLPRLSLADLEGIRDDDDGPVTCGWALLHALEHAWLHLGHLQMTCQLWKQRNTT